MTRKSDEQVERDERAAEDVYQRSRQKSEPQPKPDAPHREWEDHEAKKNKR